MTAPNIPPLRASWTGYLRGRLLHLLGRIRKTEVPPSPTEAREADRTLHLMLRPAVFGELGGFRPKTTNRHTSWWGGCALAAPGEEVPLGRSGKPMQALLQIRTDEVEMPIPGLENTELLTLWLDLEGNLFEAVEGIDFKVSTYTRMDGLVPLGPGYRERSTLSSPFLCDGKHQWLSNLRGKILRPKFQIALLGLTHRPGSTIIRVLSVHLNCRVLTRSKSAVGRLGYKDRNGTGCSTAKTSCCRSTRLPKAGSVLEIAGQSICSEAKRAPLGFLRCDFY